jgi:hypothetical protein
MDTASLKVAMPSKVEVLVTCRVSVVVDAAAVDGGPVVHHQFIRGGGTVHRQVLFHGDVILEGGLAGHFQGAIQLGIAFHFQILAYGCIALQVGVAFHRQVLAYSCVTLQVGVAFHRADPCSHCIVSRYLARF